MNELVERLGFPGACVGDCNVVWLDTTSSTKPNLIPGYPSIDAQFEVPWHPFRVDALLDALRQPHQPLSVAADPGVSSASLQWSAQGSAGPIVIEGIVAPGQTAVLLDSLDAEGEHFRYRLRLDMEQAAENPGLRLVPDTVGVRGLGPSLTHTPGMGLSTPTTVLQGLEWSGEPDDFVAAATWMWTTARAREDDCRWYHFRDDAWVRMRFSVDHEGALSVEPERPSWGALCFRQVLLEALAEGAPPTKGPWRLTGEVLVSLKSGSYGRASPSEHHMAVINPDIGGPRLVPKIIHDTWSALNHFQPDAMPGLLRRLEREAALIPLDAQYIPGHIESTYRDISKRILLKWPRSHRAADQLWELLLTEDSAEKSVHIVRVKAQFLDPDWIMAPTGLAFQFNIARKYPNTTNNAFVELMLQRRPPSSWPMPVQAAFWKTIKHERARGHPLLEAYRRAVIADPFELTAEQLKVMQKRMLEEQEWALLRALRSSLMTPRGGQDRCADVANIGSGIFQAMPDDALLARCASTHADLIFWVVNRLAHALEPGALSRALLKRFGQMALSQEAAATLVFYWGYTPKNFQSLKEPDPESQEHLKELLRMWMSDDTWGPPDPIAPFLIMRARFALYDDSERPDVHSALIDRITHEGVADAAGVSRAANLLEAQYAVGLTHLAFRERSAEGVVALCQRVIERYVRSPLSWELEKELDRALWACINVMSDTSVSSNPGLPETLQTAFKHVSWSAKTFDMKLRSAKKADEALWDPIRAYVRRLHDRERFDAADNDNEAELQELRVEELVRACRTVRCKAGGLPGLARCSYVGELGAEADAAGRAEARACVQRTLTEGMTAPPRVALEVIPDAYSSVTLTPALRGESGEETLRPQSVTYPRFMVWFGDWPPPPGGLLGHVSPHQAVDAQALIAIMARDYGQPAESTVWLERRIRMTEEVPLRVPERAAAR